MTDAPPEKQKSKRKRADDMKQEESAMKNIIGGVVFVALWLVRAVAIVLVWILLLGVILFGAATGRK